MKRLICLFALVILICGCASTGVVPMNKDTYMISKRSMQLGFGQPVGAKASVYRKANEFCTKQNKKVETVTFDMENSMVGRPGSVSLEFRCISDSDSSLK